MFSTSDLSLKNLPSTRIAGTDETNRSWKEWLRTQVGHVCSCSNPFGCSPCQLAMMLKLGPDFVLNPEPEAELLEGSPLQGRSALGRSQSVVYRFYSDNPPGYLVAATYPVALERSAWGCLRREPEPLPGRSYEGLNLFSLRPDRCQVWDDRLEPVLEVDWPLPISRDTWGIWSEAEQLWRGEEGIEPCGTCWLVRDPNLPSSSSLPEELELPSDLPPVVERLAREITRNLPQPRLRAEALERWLRSEFTYGFDHAFHDRAPILQQFLEERPPAHCEFFATAMALMLRVVGIPSRYVVGFPVGGRQWNPQLGCFELRAAHAHAWVEAYLPGAGWQFYDPTPEDGRLQAPAGSGIPPPPRENFREVPCALEPEELEAMRRERTAPGWLRRVLQHLRERDLDGCDAAPQVDPRRLLREMIRRRCSSARALRRNASPVRLLIAVDLSRSCLAFCRDTLRAALAMQRGDDDIRIMLHTNGIPFDWIQAGRTDARMMARLLGVGRDAPALARLMRRAEVGRVLCLGDGDALPLWVELHRLYGRRFTWIEPSGSELSRKVACGVPLWTCSPDRLGDAILRGGS